MISPLFAGLFLTVLILFTLTLAIVERYITDRLPTFTRRYFNVFSSIYYDMKGKLIKTT